MRDFGGVIRAALLTIALGVGLAACGVFGGRTPAPTSGTIEENVVSLTAKVSAIDHATRRVALITNDGETVEFEAGSNVRNLDQVNVGDTVRAQYFESIVYEVRRPGEAVPGVRVAEERGTAPVGEMPAAAVARAVTITATVAGIDMNAPSVKLRMADGSVRTLPVRDANRLRAVAVGDLVEFTFTQAVGIEVEHVP